MSPQINNEQPSDQQELDKVFAEPGQVQAEVIERPAIVEDVHLEYLDELRESGTTNMFGARPYLMRNFGLSGADAAVILTYWQETFGQRQAHKEAQTA